MGIKRLSKPGKPIKLSGLAIPFDLENKNGRIYELESYSDECIKKMNEDLNSLKLLGELNPDSELGEVNLGRVSHKVTKAELKKEGLYVELEILEGTPRGYIAKKFMEAFEKDGEVPFAIASRSVGTINEDKTVNVDRIISFDLIKKENSAYDENVIKVLDGGKSNYIRE